MDRERERETSGVRPLCLMRYLPRTMRRQSRMKTMTATTPPITAWSTLDEVDMAVGSARKRHRDTQ